MPTTKLAQFTLGGKKAMRQSNWSGGGVSRRDVLRAGVGIAAAAATAAPAHARSVHVAGSDEIKVALIGCGGRGSGAAVNCVNAAPGVKLVAMADIFSDRLEASYQQLQKRIGDKMDVPAERRFSGWDAYKHALECADLAILACPPHFRPRHLKAAIDAGKHVFAEKPVAVDAAGVRSVWNTVQEAKKKNLAIVSGLCWRYDDRVRELMKRVHDGQIGDITAIEAVYIVGYLRVFPRKPEWSDMEWQLRNWWYFTWLSGDLIAEQHIHSLDKAAWAMDAEHNMGVYPETAWSLGGRQVRVEPEYGHTYDHMATQYEYPNGVRLFSYCRQIRGCYNLVNDYIFGTKGIAEVLTFRIVDYKGNVLWKHSGPVKNMYDKQHEELIAGIRAGKPINDGEYMTNSTMMAILGRMAAYTGQHISWKDAWNSKEDLTPPQYEFGPLPVPPVAKPGITKFC